jgi:predicted transcriptional regulator
MNTHLELPADLEAVLQQIAAREKRDVNDLIQDALQRFAAENSRAMPSWVGMAEGAVDLSERVDELLFADGLRP